MSDFAQDFYWKMREAVAGKRIGRDEKRRQKAAKSTSKPFQPGRDPVKAGDSLDALVADFAWGEQLAEGELLARWAEVVGAETAANSIPEDLVDGTLTIRCASTAWATQLRLISEGILERISTDFPQLKITALKMLAPEAPSWKKGPRSVPGRGPRDTYG